MGQSSSTSNTNTTSSTRHDNASTRTLHSTSIYSQRPVSFFRRISNRLHVTHPTRRFGRPGRQNHQNINNHHHTSASSTTSSVRRATQEATRQAAAVTGPPASFLIHSSSSSTSPPLPPPVPLNSSRNSIISSDTYLNELLSSAVFRDNNSVHSSSHESQRGNSFLRYLQIPLRMQDNTTATTTTTTTSQSSASSITSRRMHILVIEYRTNNNNNAIEDTTSPLTPPPTYRFLGLRRPRSEVSTTSSTETIQSMPLSMNSNQTMSNRNTSQQPQQPQQPQQQEGQWIVYVLNNNNNNNNNNSNTPLQTLSSSLVLEDNPSYEDLLWLTNMLGPARPNTTTQAAVDEAIPVTDWSNEIKDEHCLVCLDEFAFKQPVRVLKCHHVFHRECVDRWLCEAHNSCPVCRGVPV